MEKVKVGLIGCGNISRAYLETFKQFDIVNLVACADLDLERARETASQYNIPVACSTEELLANPEIEIVVNLTTPQHHYPVVKAALNAGKHAHTEKPLCVEVEEALELQKLAQEKNLRLGNAPDTFLGGAHQTCRKLVDEGWIGAPVGGTAFMMSPGHERWHPAPEFYYQKGGGPMFDMGPYYLTAMVNLLGPVSSVAGMTRTTFPTRTITSEPKRGQTIEVEVPTHVTALLRFENGAIVNMITSFDVAAHTLPPIQLFGTSGTLQVPDPNSFMNPISIKRAGQEEWAKLPATHFYDNTCRGLGVADLAFALRYKRPHRCCGDLGVHVLEIMHAIHTASDTNNHIEMKTRCERPEPLPLDLEKGRFDTK
jgi:predicted dehydrogenase